MSKFLKDNKWLIIIVIVSFIIGAWLYYSNLNRVSVHQSKETTYTTSNEESHSSGSEKVSSDSCVNYKEAANFVGEHKCIYGRIVYVYISKAGNVFLNFCGNYKTCPFSSFIHASDASKFSDLKHYQGKMVEITGLVQTYKGRPEIVINEPQQIKIR